MRIAQIQKLTFLMYCVGVLALAYPAMGQEQLPATKKVLIFEREPYGPTVLIAEDAIKQHIQDNKKYRIQFYRESLDTSRIPDEKYDAELVTLLQRKYADDRPDLIFVLGVEPLKFLLRHETTLFSNVPKVYTLSEERLLNDISLGRNTTGVAGSVEFVPTVELMLAQNPNARKIWVITGSTDQNLGFRDRAEAAFTAFAGRVEFVYPEPQSVEQLRDTLSTLPRGDLALFIAFGRDATGRGFTAPEVVKLLAPTSAVPIYAVTDHVVGSGVVGGDVLSFNALSVAAAEMGLQILDGEPLGNVPPRVGRHVPMFDWRQLQKWGIDENKLPVGSIVEFRTPSVWEQYGWYIAAAVAIILLQAVLIAALLITRSRRRTAELERSEFRSLAVAEHARLNDVVSNVPGIVWESRAVNGGGERRVQFVSGYVEEMLGYSVDECMATDDFLRSKVVKEDREVVDQEEAVVLMHGNPVVVQFRIAAKNGALKWAESHVVAVRDASGKPIGRRGVTMDITERKKAEENVRAKERQLVEAQRLAQVGSWEWDSATDTVTWSDEIYRIYGLDPSGPASSFADHPKLMTPGSWQKLQAAVTETLENGRPYELELEIIHTDGRHLWASARGEADEAEGGKRLRGTLQDITERKLAEESLKKALHEINELKNEIHEENIYLKEMIKLEHDYDEIIGTSDALKYVLFKIEQVAPTDTTVLITGETGTGKDLVAHAIHRNSLRRDRPLVRVNCAALSSTLIESELFGHERGAFTGASARKIGRFELADGGTIFLDEVGELPLELQAKLLRLIQEGEFERLGSSKTITADVRIMAATNRNLEAEVSKGRFREDLLFRLNVFPITVPPLRDRRDDVPLLVEHFTSYFAKKLGKSITSVSPATMRSLMRYNWPGNIRELANVIERAVIGTRGETLQLSEIPGADKVADIADTAQSLEAVERNHIIRTLLNTGWRVDGPQGAARILGINPSTLRTRMNKLGIVKNAHVH